MPEGFLAAAGDFASSVLTRQTSADRPLDTPTSPESATEALTTTTSRTAQQAQDGSGNYRAKMEPIRSSTGDEEVVEVGNLDSRMGSTAKASGTAVAAVPADNGAAVRNTTAPFPNGYHFPPKHSFGESFRLGMAAFWRYVRTPLGFFVVLYGLNVVAWGGMLFLLLCNAAPAMCYPTCNDINSPRRKWIEIDSQIVNALFCVTGFGLAPWRFRDLYYLLQYRIFRKEMGLRRLAGIHRSWFRLPGSQHLDPSLGPHSFGVANAALSDAQLASSPPALPYPETSMPDPPRTGHRAPPTRTWKLDFVIWMNVSNTFLQCVLSGFMWGFNRFTRPSWAVGLFVALACGVAAAGGIMMFVEGKKVKGIEGVPVSERDLQRLEHDKELGIEHYNNLKGKPPKERKEPKKN